MAEASELMLDMSVEGLAGTARPSRAADRALLTVLAVLIGGCLLSWVWSPYDPTQLSATPFAQPSAAHLLGTDELGRDLLSRIMVGGRTTLFVAGGATLLVMVAGLAWGMLAALSGGWVDEVLMRLADAAMAVPQILFALVFVAAFGGSPSRLMLIVGILLMPATARLLRSVTLTEIKQDYYLSAVAYGAGRSRVILTELLPNMAAPLAAQAAINLAQAIILEAGLGFLGLGIQPPATSWGVLLQGGYQNMYQSVMVLLVPAAFIFVTIWTLNLMADALMARNAVGKR